MSSNYRPHLLQCDLLNDRYAYRLYWICFLPLSVPFQKICMMNFGFTCNAYLLVNFVNHFNDLVRTLQLQGQFVVVPSWQVNQKLLPYSKLFVPTFSVILLFVNTLYLLQPISGYLECFLKVMSQVKYILKSLLTICLFWPRPKFFKNLHGLRTVLSKFKKVKNLSLHVESYRQIKLLVDTCPSP